MSNEKNKETITSAVVAAAKLCAALGAESLSVRHLSDGDEVSFRVPTESAFSALVDVLGSPVEMRRYERYQWTMTTATLGGIVVKVSGPHVQLPEPAEIDVAAIDEAVSAAEVTP